MNETPASASRATGEPHPSLVTLTHVTYGLHALGLGIGAFGAATVLGVFAFGWPSIFAVILTYVKRAEAEGTWLESHFRWQLHTFWVAFAVACLALLMGAGLVLTALVTQSRPSAGMTAGFAAWGLVWIALGLWAIYRTVRGWRALAARRAVP
jgi:uncharacterized membrane protein